MATEREWFEAMTELQQDLRKREASCRAMVRRAAPGSDDWTHLHTKATAYGHAAEMLFDDIERLTRDR